MESEEITAISPLRLARSLNSAHAARLLEQLQACRGSPLEIDGGEVDHLGALSFQILVAARNSWIADGLDFRLINPSASMCRDLELLGHSAQLFAAEGIHE